MQNNSLIAYKSIRNKIQTMDLIQWHGNGFISNLIGWKTTGKWNSGAASHSGVAARLDIDRVLTLHAVNDGCVPWPLSHALKHYNGTAYWHPVKKAYQHDAIEAFNWMYEKIGTGYDWQDLANNWLGRISANLSGNLKKMFCSEYVFWGWRKGVAEVSRLDNTYEWLVAMNEIPVPIDMPHFGIYEEVGHRLI